MQDLSDRSYRFLEKFVRLSVGNGLKTAAACREFGISRSIFYDIRAGKREVTAKMEARLRQVEQLPQNRREAVINSLLPNMSDTQQMSDMSENEQAEENAVISESDAKFAKRLDALETGARHYFEDAAEVFKQVKTLPESGHLELGQSIVLKGMAKSLGALQPWIEQGLTQLLKDNRILHRIAKAQNGEPGERGGTA